LSKGDTFENDFLKLIFWGTAIANIADNAAGSPLTSLYLSLHTADPGEGGNQTTNEISYTPYARIAVLRSVVGFNISGSVVTLAANATFAQMASGAGGTVTHFALGTASSGAGKILYSGTCTPNQLIGVGATPILDTTTQFTED
jgi:hypothetical protein